MSEKSRASVVGRAYAAVIDALDAEGYASLPAVLERLFPDDAPDEARRALATQIINRPPLAIDGTPLLRLKTDRVVSKGGPSARTQSLNAARVWFESAGQADSAAQTPVRPRYPAKNFTPSDAITATGQELAQVSEVLRQSLIESELNPAPKVELNGSMRHGTDPKHFILTHGSSQQQRLRRQQEMKEERGSFDEPETVHLSGNPQDTSAGTKPAKDLPQAPALEAMLRWAVDDTADTPHLLALLGDYGTGKTSHALQFARVLNGDASDATWEQIKTDKSQPQRAKYAQQLRALFIDLAELASVTRLAELTLEDMLLIVLRKRGAGVESLTQVQAFLRQARAGQLIMVFDGLDELLKNESQVLHNVFGQLLRVLQAPAQPNRPAHSAATTPARLMISCRTHYFRSIEQQNAFFDTRKRGAAAGDDYLTLTLLPWGNEHIETYLGKRLAEADAQKLLHIIRTTYDLEQLASRPVLLAMMSEQLEALLRKAKDGTAITAAQMYNITVAEWIARDDGKHHLAPEHKPLLMGALAAAMWDDGVEAWSADRLDPWLLRTALALFDGRYPPQFAAAMQNDLRTATFIVRPDTQRFNFAHRSFMEYFLARFWVDAIAHAAMENISLASLRSLLPRRALNHEAMQFLRELWVAETLRIPAQEMAQRAACLWRLLQEEGAPAPSDADALHHTVFNLIVMLGLARGDADVRDVVPRISSAPLNLRGLSFIGEVWQDLDLRALPPLDLRGANLRGLHARRCRFGRVLCDDDSTGTGSTGSNWSQAVLRDCDTQGIEWGRSRRSGMIVRRGPLPLLKGVAQKPLPGPWAMPAVLGPIHCAAFSPDGTRIATASGDNTARLWDAASGRELLVLKGHGAAVSSVAFSPDGARIATASNDNTARLWDAASGRELLAFTGHADVVWGVAFSPDGARIATASHDDTARLWDTASGRELLAFTGHADVVWGVAFSPDGVRIATASDDGTARLWDTVSGREIITFRGHGAWVSSVTFSPDGARIATASDDGTARLWDAISGRELLALNGHGRGFTNGVTGVAFSQNGARIVTTSADNTARVWDAVSGREIIALTGHANSVTSVAFSPDGARIATSSVDNTARLWDAASGRELLALSGHGARVRSAAFSPTGARIASASGDNTARVWDAASGRELLVLKGHGRGVTSVAFSPDGARIATASADDTARLWDAASGRELLAFKGHSAWVSSAAFSPDGARIATASADNTARLWDAASGRELLSLTGHGDWVMSVAFSPDGARIATASVDKTARLWDAASGRELLALKGHDDAVRTVAFSLDGARIATASADYTARLWDAASGSELLALKGHRRGLTSGVMSVAFSPDGARIATAGFDNTARLWDAASGRELLALKGHGASVMSVAFSPDGARIVTASQDGTVRLWDLPKMGDETDVDGSSDSESRSRCRVFVPHPAAPFTNSWADFDPQGNLLACNEAAADHWLFRVRDGVSEPIEAAL